MIKQKIKQAASPKASKASPWHASTLSKYQGEQFFLQWSAIWICVVIYIVFTEIYETFTDFQYLLLGLFIGLPPVLLPILFPSYCDDSSLPLLERYTTKASIWIGIYSFVGNYVCTHYFYTVLGVKYTFLNDPTQRLNDVPIIFYFMTHSYFLLYHVLSTRLLRRVMCFASATTQYPIMAVTVFLFSYIVAFMETFTIQSFPYYTYPDKRLMFKVGSLSYALYFFVSFPAFFRMDEWVDKYGKWTVRRTVWDVLATCMLVILLLEAWRVILGPLYDVERAQRHTGTPWIVS